MKLVKFIAEILESLLAYHCEYSIKQTKIHDFIFPNDTLIMRIVWDNFHTQIPT